MSAFKRNRKSVKKTSNPSGGKNRRGPGRQFRFQVLEDRRVLSITPPVFEIGQATLVIAGGDLDDTVVISESLEDATIIVQQYELNERLTTTFPKSSITSLHFLGHGGNDRLTNRTDLPVYAEGGSGNDSLTGGSGDDTLRGGPGEDRLEGRDGDDELHGDGGADVLHGEFGSDLLVGGGGNDLLYGGEGDDRLYGVGGDDYLDGAAGEDYLNGGAEDDRLYGGSDDDFLNGHTGDDQLFGRSGDDTLLGGGGADVLRGEAGDDYLIGGADNDTLYGDDGNDRLYGSAGDDLLYGSNGEDYLNGGGDSDRLYGGKDDDFLNGDRGDDRILGQDGDDVVLGGDGDDIVFGGPGDDRLDGGGDNDTLYGEDGGDLLYGRSGNDHLEGGLGEDYLNGGDGDDLLLGGLDADYLTGELGDDRLEGGDGDDTLLGGDGIDVLHGEAGADRLDGGSDKDTIYGGDGDDTAEGGSGNDLIDGGAGTDSLSGGSGADHLYGGTGADYLSGGAGEDRLEGQGGDDHLFGGDDADVLHGDADNDRLSGEGGDDTLYGDEGDDWVSGGSGDDIVRGAAGDDELHGGDGADLLLGEAGDDLLSGDNGDDRLEGEAGADILLGSNGMDSLVGGVGRDLVIGGGGGDTLTGSEGEDILIGSSTAYDADSEALRQALVDWNAEVSYEERVALLSDAETHFRLVPHETVFADFVADTVVGGGDRDWFVLSAVNGVYNPLGISHHHGMSHHHEILLNDAPVLEGFALIDSIDRLENQLSTEAVHTSMVHAGDASKLGEHLQLFQLVRYAEVTHMAVADGAWADPSTWENGSIPTAGARVLIPYGASVTVDSRLQAELFSIRVDGSLSFSATTDSELRVDTLVVTGTGSFQMGTSAAPVQEGVSAKLIITDDGPIDRQADPFGLGRGLITHGQVKMHGTEVTPFVTANGAIHAGDTTVQLASATTGWSVGDTIAIAGTAIGGGQDEVRVILAINGNELTIDPLDFDHLALEPGLEIHVTNLTRNVVIESAASVDSRRGHVMFMHNRDVHISHAAFNGLGRTDKSVVLTDPKVDADWNLIGDTGSNPRARYAVHFHRNGVKADSPPATVDGSVVVGGPGWGYVNHSSYVDFTNNVSYGVRGAAYVAEAGDEIGLFDSNLALHTTGSTADIDSRVGHQDFGFSGEGFWLQGPGVAVTNNVVSGSAGSAFIYYTRGLTVGGHEIVFLAENLDDPSIAEGNATIPVISTPIKKFENNVGYASQVGLTVRYNLRDAAHAASSIVSDSVFWNNETGVDLPYAHHAVLRNLVVLVDPASNALNGVDNNAQTRSVTYENLRVEGYQRAIVAPLQGENVIDGGLFASKNANIIVLPAHARGLQVLVTGAPQFGSVEGYSALDISMNYQTQNAARNPHLVFYEVEVLLNYGAFPDHQLYFRQQHADAIPFPEALPGLNLDYVGLPQSDLLYQFGVAVGGEIAPDNADTASDIYGLIAPRRSTLPRQLISTQ